MPPSQTTDNILDKHQNNQNNRPDPQIKVKNFEQFPAPLSNQRILFAPNPYQVPNPSINNEYTNIPG